MLFLAGCAATTTAPPLGSPGLPAVNVPAAGETVPVASQLVDAADDPAIFARDDSARFTFDGKSVEAVILGTDKKAGLYVYDLEGASLQFLPDGLLNNVDLRPDGQGGFIAGASDRGRMGVALYRFVPGGKLEAAGFIKSDVAEPYGFCMGRLNGTLVAVLVAKDGGVRQYAIGGEGNALTGTEQRRFAVGTQSEGCVVDDKTGDLYIGEEMKGLWRFRLDPADTARTLIAGLGDGKLVADVEGVTLIEDGGERHLIVSSQGDSAFAVWRLVAGGDPVWVGRFRVIDSDKGDAVSGTDGVDARGGRIGRFANGLVVVQDDENVGGPQNYKLVDWATIRAALAAQ